MKIKLLLLLLCLFAGNAFATPTTPTSDFIDNRDGTVTHKTTGLTWMRCALGQTWTGSACSGTASTYTYDQAVALTGTFAGHSDWRVPNIAELQTLVERENMNPTINTDLFPNSHSQTFWSSSPYVGSTNYAWDVDFYDGDVGRDLILRSLPVRLVRASQSLGIGLSTPNTDFTDNKDGTVTHKRTGLVWQRCAVGQTWTGSTCSGTADRYTYDAAMALTVRPWRVPTASELASIVKYDTVNPSVNPSINQDQFPNTPVDAFWSSSPYVGVTSYAWVVKFYYGIVDGSNRGYSLPVRLVRASQSIGYLPFTIGQSPITASPGQLFIQWGNSFTPNTTAILHVKKPDGSEYPTQKQAIDSTGHFGINYKIPANKPEGTYQWWVVDRKTGKKSAVISYQITPPVNIAKISGKLHINAANGAALSGAKVSTGIIATTTANDGSFSLAKIPAGDQVINFSKPGYQPFSVTIPVPAVGSYAMGNRWLVKDGTVKPSIAQAPMSALPGTTFSQWGTGFTPNGTATLHFKKPDNSEYPTSTVALDTVGHLETAYHTPMDKPAGVYSWWAVDDVSHKASNTVAYTVTEEVNTCEAPTQYDSLLKISDAEATCRDKWNLTIFYKERYYGFFDMNQKLLQASINGTLDANSKITIVMDGISSILSIHDIPSLKTKDISTLVAVGASQSMQFSAKAIDDQFADIVYGALGAAAETVVEGGNPKPAIEYAITTGGNAINNLLATIGITTSTKRFQELEIAKQYLLNFYQFGSRIDLLSADYGLSASAGMEDIIKAIADRIGAGNSWYWFDNYDIQNVVDYIRADTTIVSMKQTEYSK
ncbi:MAG: DUF1566 domain-containing protein [Methylococcaceae bacterium]